MIPVEEHRDTLDFYARPGLMTDAGQFSHLFDALPAEPGELCRVVQGLMVHIFWAERYGLKLSEERKQEVQIRPVDRKLARLLELDASPLTVARPPEKKLVGNCRDFAVVLVSVLRHKGIPARARCGFGMYFTPGHGEDHWVCEYWKAEEQRWVMFDPQLDDLQKQVLGISFNALDMPAGQFWTGGQAWLVCRAGQADAESFGIFDMHGLWFIRGNVVRDLLSLDEIEILPWDHWGILSKEDKDLSDGDWQFVDRVAALCQQGDEALPVVRSICDDDERVKLPPGWQP